MGTPSFSVTSLKLLNDSPHKILRVYTQPPQKKSRGQKFISSPVEIFAQNNSLEVRHPSKIDNDEDYEFLKKVKPSLVIVVAYGQIIPKRFLNIPDLLFLNLHASLLPKWRGAAPIERSIMNMDKETGISIMKIVPELDSGPFLKQVKVNIENSTTAGELREKLSLIGANTLLECINLLEKEKPNFREQEHSSATYAKKIKKEEAKINWSSSPKEIIAQINALNPSPGAWFDYNKSRHKIFGAIEIKKSGKSGQLLDNDLTIACSENAIQVTKIQKEGKKILNRSKFLVGNKIKKGTQLS